MTIKVSPQLEQYIRDKVKAGQFADESQVVTQALEFLKAQDEIFDRDQEWLRKQVAIGVEEADRGLTRDWDPDAVSDEVERRHAESTRKPGKKAI